MRRGLTLVEVIASCFLMLLLMTLAVSLATFSQRSYVEARAEGEAVLNGNTVLQRIVLEVGSSDTNLTNRSGDWVCFANGFREGRFVTNDEGRPVWQNYVLYYQWNDQLLRREISGPLPITGRLAPEIINASRDGTGQVVAREVASFKVTLGGVALDLELNQIPRPGMRKADWTYREARIGW